MNGKIDQILCARCGQPMICRVQSNHAANGAVRRDVLTCSNPSGCKGWDIRLIWPAEPATVAVCRDCGLEKPPVDHDCSAMGTELAAMTMHMREICNAAG